MYKLFVDGHSSHPERLDVDTARSFFELGKMPHGFHRANEPLTSMGNALDVVKLQKANTKITPGKKNGTVNSFTSEHVSFELEMCGGYSDFVNAIPKLYPNVTGDLRTALKLNLHYFYQGFESGNCTELFPYGK